MVNKPASPPDRRERTRVPASGSRLLGTAKLNPLGDLHTVQHLSARLAKGLRTAFEPVLRTELRTWAEPLAVQRFSDWRLERGEGLTAWASLAVTGAGADARILVALDGRFVLRMLDLFFGGTGVAVGALPDAFSPAADALVARIADALAAPLDQAWEPVAPLRFTFRSVDAAPAIGDAEEAVVATRFGIAAGDARPDFLDILYPTTALKPYAATLAGKVVDKAEPDPVWRNNLTRATMAVRFPVRSVLAEPVVALTKLMDLKPGDVIPISIAPDVPVMVGNDRLGHGTVGVSNGHAAIRLTALALPEGLNP